MPLPQQQEEQQAKEFLKRAEISTMRKDLSLLRESDSLKERNKIANIKTLEEQTKEHQQQLEAAEKAKGQAQAQQMQGILQKNVQQEQDAEKGLKTYATEEERQKIYLFESQKFTLQKQIEATEKTTEPGLQLEKNNIQLQMRQWQESLRAIVDQENKIQNEQKLVIETSQRTTIPSERKSLEGRASDLDAQTQDIERKRSEVETQINGMQARVNQINDALQKMVVEKNRTQNTILGIDASLRDIYSEIINREDQRKNNTIKEQQEKMQATAAVRATEKENVQREQWSKKPDLTQKTFLKDTPESLKQKLADDTAKEEEQRKKFVQEVAQASEKNSSQPLEKSNIQNNIK